MEKLQKESIKSLLNVLHQRELFRNVRIYSCWKWKVAQYSKKCTQSLIGPSLPSFSLLLSSVQATQPHNRRTNVNALQRIVSLRVVRSSLLFVAHRPTQREWALTADRDRQTDRKPEEDVQKTRRDRPGWDGTARAVMNGNRLSFEPDNLQNNGAPFLEQIYTLITCCRLLAAIRLFCMPSSAIFPRLSPAKLGFRSVPTIPFHPEWLSSSSSSSVPF